ncbi:MAG: hypothetical protein PHQ64_02935 [Bacilli bacterium]|nr:hypothetical protein [Bacilli bacterium]
MNCPNCGSNLPFGTEVCPICNIQLVEKKKQPGFEIKKKRSLDLSKISKAFGKILLSLIVISIITYGILYFTVFHTLKNQAIITFDSEKVETVYGLTKIEASSAIEKKENNKKVYEFKYKKNKLNYESIYTIENYLIKEKYKMMKITTDSYFFAKNSTMDGMLLVLRIQKTSDNYIFSFSKELGSLESYELNAVTPNSIEIDIDYTIKLNKFLIEISASSSFVVLEKDEDYLSLTNQDLDMNYNIKEINKDDYYINLKSKTDELKLLSTYQNISGTEETSITINEEAWYCYKESYLFNSQTYYNYYFYKELDKNNLLSVEITVINKDLSIETLSNHINTQTKTQ